MALDFRISGGTLRMPKTLFVREMLSPRSPLKALLNYELEDGGKTRAVGTDGAGKGGIVTVDFTAASDVSVGDDFENLVSDVKKKYGADVGGRITLTADYYAMVTVVLDLDSPDGTLRVIH